VTSNRNLLSKTGAKPSQGNLPAIEGIENQSESGRNYRVHHTKNSHTDMKNDPITPVPEQDLEDSPRQNTDVSKTDLSATAAATKSYQNAKAYVNQIAKQRNRS
jgi:hypothetical protein